MDTATASLQNKPLEETEEHLGDASPDAGWIQLALDIEGRHKKSKVFKYHFHYWQEHMESFHASVDVPKITCSM